MQDAIRYAIESAIMQDIPVPPKEIMFSRFWVKNWVERHKEIKKNRARD